MEVKELLEYNFFNLGKYHLNAYELILLALLLLFARFFLFLVKKYLERQRLKERLDKGREYAIYQMIVYLTYVITLAIGLESVGVKITVFLAGSTALLVGLGLGLQDFFKALVAGFIILTERTVSAGDVVEIAGTVGQVKEISLRTTTVTTRDDIVMIIPNQQLISDRVINWSQNKKSTRFGVSVGVAYGSDTRLVEKLLLEVAMTNELVQKDQAPTVQFKDFGSSSLDFTLFFYSFELFRIEYVKSQLRYGIDQKFRENNIQIPFPQRDLWLRNPEVLKSGTSPV
jgi:small-conductance mechanosensitive channel